MQFFRQFVAFILGLFAIILIGGGFFALYYLSELGCMSGTGMRSPHCGFHWWSFFRLEGVLLFWLPSLIGGLLTYFALRIFKANEEQTH